jgi:hypothetical protein
MANARQSVFISYVLRDAVIGELVASTIRRRRPNVRVFDHFELSMVEPSVAKVRDWIVKCDLFIVVLTPNSIESDNILAEVGAAWGLGKPIIKVLPRGYVAGSHLPVNLHDQPILWLEDIGESDALDTVLEKYIVSEDLPAAGGKPR